jgi:divalent metal cation (Fe/Co/Zn/Cd) transporter
VSTSARVIADHYTDALVTTPFSFGIFTSAAGAKIAWWLDPLGAIIISLVILTSWSRTAYLQFRELAGAAAPPEFLQLVTYNAMLHHADIEKIDSCKAYHSGPKVRSRQCCCS